MTVLLPLDAPRFAIHIFRACMHGCGTKRRQMKALVVTACSIEQFYTTSRPPGDDAPI